MALRPTSTGQPAQLGLGDEATFVAREEELGQLVEESLEVSELGRPAVVTVSGEAGVGKSRLINELVRFAAELPDERMLRGRAMPYGEGRHLGPLVELVRTACGIVDGEDAGTMTDRVRRTLARLEQSAPALTVSSASTTACWTCSASSRTRTCRATAPRPTRWAATGCWTR